MEKQFTTLLLAIKDGKIMLAEKKRGFGVGKINGVGGKVEPNETVEEAMLRETKEEAGIIPIDHEKVAVIMFDEFVNGVRKMIIMNVFLCSEFEGTPRETEEMKPCWFSLDKIPYYRMFPDDKLWLPEVLAGKKIEGCFWFDENFNMIDYKIKEVIEF